MEQILGILGSVGFNWHVALANFVNFLIILFILNKFFFGKIGKTIAIRHEMIERGLTQATEAQKVLLGAEEKKKEIVTAAEKEGKNIIKEAYAKGESLAQTLTQEAQGKIDQKVHDLKVQEEQLQSRVEDAFAKKAPSLVAELYKKTLLKEMNEDENDAFIGRIHI